MLDPFYRTIKGYQVLIEKDWLAFGHKFGDRCGYTQGDPKEMSPVFTQFLDCTFQLMQQRIDAFEFNERFLLTLHDHVQSCQFGTFIGNCEKDRLDLRMSESTYSLWGYMSNHLNEYINPLYRPEMDEIIRPNLAPQSIKFWRGMYGRFESGVHPREPLGDLLLASRDHCTSLEDHVNHLTKVKFLFDFIYFLLNVLLFRLRLRLCGNTSKSQYSVFHILILIDFVSMVYFPILQFDLPISFPNSHSVGVY